MSATVLARKWRPKNFETLVGQEHVVRALQHALRSRRLHHAYLLTGTRGVGKTTIARILAKALNCIGANAQGPVDEPCGRCEACAAIDAGRFVDYIEIDAASNRGVSDIAQVLEQAVYAPTAGRYKVYVVDEVHMLSSHAFNAMLKTLEEPPPHVLFILATTDPQRIPVTVLSRCLQFNLKAMLPSQIADHLAFVLQQETIEAERAALALIGKSARGSMRDALSLTDQAIAFGGGRLGEPDVRQMLGVLDSGTAANVLRALIERDAKSLMTLSQALATSASAALQALDEIAALLHQIAVAQVAPEALDTADPEVGVVQAFSKSLTAQDVQLHYQIALLARRDLDLSPDPQTGLSMALLRMLAFQPENLQPVVTAKPRPLTAPDRPAAAPDNAFDWPTLSASLAVVGLAKQLAQQSELVAWDGQHLKLRVAARMLAESTPVNRLRDALGELLGQAVRVSVQVVASAQSSDLDTAAVRHERVESQQREQAEQALRSDPVVQRLMTETGATIVPGSIRPVTPPLVGDGPTDNDR